MRLYYNQERASSSITKFINKYVKNYDHVVCVREGRFDVLVGDGNNLTKRGGLIYLEGVNISQHRSSFKSLLISGENIEPIPGFSRYEIIIRLNWRIYRRVSAIFPFLGNRLLDIYFLLIKSSFLERSGRPLTGPVFYWPQLTNYIKDISGSDNYAVISNDKMGADRKNVFHLPFFFSRCGDDWDRYIEIKRERLYEEKRRFCAFIVSTETNYSYVNQLRLFFCYELSKYKKVDCYGSAFHNREMPLEMVKKHVEYPAKLARLDKTDIRLLQKNGHHPNCGKLDRRSLNQELFRDYKFVICFENSVSKGYITEKLPDVMLGNSIGIYHGAPDVSTYFNPESFINYGDFPDYRAVIRKIIELDQDDAAYIKMLRAPFFVDNRIPEAIWNKENALTGFLDTIFAAR